MIIWIVSMIELAKMLNYPLKYFHFLSLIYRYDTEKSSLSGDFDDINIKSLVSFCVCHTEYYRASGKGQDAQEVWRLVVLLEETRHGQ